MYEDESSNEPAEQAQTPQARATEHADRFRMHAELAAVFEGPRKFEVQLLPLDANLARDIQRTVGRLEKARAADNPIIPPAQIADAAALLSFPATRGLSTSDYHIAARPGEVMIVRWLAGEECDTFYERLQAHFDAAMNAFRDDERTSLEWKQSPENDAYLKALDGIEINMPERYHRPTMQKHKLVLMTTQTADEINIVYLTETVMGVPPADLVGERSAPPPDPTEQDLAWFFKLFSLRGIDGTERMCFFTYLQKSDDPFDA